MQNYQTIIRVFTNINNTGELRDLENHYILQEEPSIQNQISDKTDYNHVGGDERKRTLMSQRTF